MPRLFAAISLPSVVTEQLDELCHGLFQARWVDSDSFHLTLHFFGDVDSEAFYDLGEELGRVSLPPFELELGGIGVFPTRGTPHQIWVGVARNNELMKLRRQIVHCAAEVGILSGRRKYLPHVTLGRLQQPVPDWALASYFARHCSFRAVPFSVSEFSLFSSFLRRDGAIHRREADYDFVRSTTTR